MSELIDEAVLELVEVELPCAKPYLSHSSVLELIRLISCVNNEKWSLVGAHAFDRAAAVLEVKDLLKQACEKYCSTLSLHSPGDDKNPGL